MRPFFALLVLCTVACRDKAQPSGETGEEGCTPTTEVCDGVDNDCDGLVDDADEVEGQGTWYVDDDEDGFGDSVGESVLACEAPSGSVDDASDCDDGDAEVNPAAAELCDGVDNDCDGLTDDEDALATGDTWYPDADGDGYGDAHSEGTLACEGPSGSTADSSDCDDGDAMISPAAEEVENGVDDDCDGEIDEDLPVEDGYDAWFEDLDGKITDLTATLGAGSVSVPVSYTAPAVGSLHVAAGTWYISVSSSEDLEITGEEGTILDGAGLVQLVSATGGFLGLYDLEMQNGTGTLGGCVSFTGDTLIIEGVAFTECHSGKGGAVYSEASLVAVAQSTFTDNGADIYVDNNYHGGAVYLASSDASFTDCSLTGNLDGDPSYSLYSDNRGGAIYHAGGSLMLDGSTISNNGETTGYYDYSYGGGVYSGGTVEAIDSVISGNQAGSIGQYGAGGGIYAMGVVTLDGTTVSGNKAASKYDFADGGAVHASWVDVVDSTVTSNATDTYGTSVITTVSGGSCTTSTFSGNNPADVSLTSATVGSDMSDCASGTESW